MGLPGVAFEQVSKKFRRGERHNSLRDLIPALIKRGISGRPPAEKLAPQEFWALRNVSFAVRPGEALGIVGRNGAGKSTVLKILSRIMKPTAGVCRIDGRVGALIEIAAGFHPDLTGRQNLYLQGAIMGMRRQEVDRKFDDIVNFADLGEFIDTPVKRYSSGMGARLGFAIAAHLDPDVLLVDEVLSVGDFAFQERAFDRLKDIVRRGVPTIVVSHQLERIAALCTHVLVLSYGEVSHYGTAAASISAYLTQSTQTADASAGLSLRLLALDVSSQGGTVRSGERITLCLAGVRDSVDTSGVIAFSVRSVKSGQTVYSSDYLNCGGGDIPLGPFVVEVSLQLNVPSGLHVVETSIVDATDGRRLVEGPGRVIEVLDGQWFQGVAQLNGTMRVLSR